ncbi:MAG: methyltransferase domain-containing protein [Parvularculaceae bacterium]
MNWDPELYAAYSDQRLRPAADLIARIPLEAPARIVDLGCGAGAGARLLRARWPHAEITGVDDSPEMLARARAAMPEISWREGDIAEWEPEAPPDLLFSNAALHWLDSHERLFPRLAGMLAKGGVLAVQMPDNFSAPSHRGVRKIAGYGSWAPRFADLLERKPVAPLDHYVALLEPLGEVAAWRATYPHRLEGEDSVFNWLSGATLRPFLSRLTAGEAKAFQDACRRELARAYPMRGDGSVLFDFARIFIIVQRS